MGISGHFLKVTKRFVAMAIPQPQVKSSPNVGPHVRSTANLAKNKKDYSSRKESLPEELSVSDNQ